MRCSQNSLFKSKLWKHFIKGCYLLTALVLIQPDSFMSEALSYTLSIDQIENRFDNFYDTRSTKLNTKVNIELSAIKAFNFALQSNAFKFEALKTGALPNQYYSHDFFPNNKMKTSMHTVTDIPITQALSVDHCLECDDTCCPCCAVVALTYLYIFHNNKVSEHIFNSVKTLQFDSPFFFLLRPPKYLNT